MAEQVTNVNIERTIEATVIRCKCGDPPSHEGQHCPQGERVPLGVIAYEHTDPLKNALGKLRVRLNSAKNKQARLGG